MPSSLIPIQGTFDIARVRANLRMQLASHHWPPRFSARSTLAMTALGEVIIGTLQGKTVTVQIDIHEENNPCVELSTVLRIRADETAGLERMLENFQHAVDALDIVEKNGMFYLTVKVFVEGA